MDETDMKWASELLRDVVESALETAAFELLLLIPPKKEAPGARPEA